MATIVGWFPTLLQARSGVLDLLTAGIPRDSISAITRLAQPAAVALARPQSRLDGVDDETTTGTVNPHDFVTALNGTTIIALPDNESVLAAGPLSAVLPGSYPDTLDGDVSQALLTIGVAPDQARQYAAQLSQGGAVLVVQVDDIQNEIVSGVFHQALTPALQEPRETVGPTPSDALVTDPGVGPVSATIGALSGTVLAGAWGAANPLTAEQAEQSAGHPSTHENNL